jgi:hypothetical protein
VQSYSRLSPSAGSGRRWARRMRLIEGMGGWASCAGTGYKGGVAETFELAVGSNSFPLAHLIRYLYSVLRTWSEKPEGQKRFGSCWNDELGKFWKRLVRMSSRNRSATKRDCMEC